MELDELREKAAYIKGLIDGLGIDDSTNEGKVLRAMSDLLSDMAQAICDDDDEITNLYGMVDDLTYGEDDEEEDDEAENDPTDLENEPYYEVACPACGETVYVSEDDLDTGEAICPSCKAIFEVALADEEDEGDDDGPVQYEVTCSHCGASSVMDEDALLNGDAVCPQCGQPLDLDIQE